jgi:hypothetical protein
VGGFGQLARELMRENVVRRNATPVESLEPVLVGGGKSENIAV